MSSFEPSLIWPQPWSSSSCMLLPLRQKPLVVMLGVAYVAIGGKFASNFEHIDFRSHLMRLTLLATIYMRSTTEPGAVECWKIWMCRSLWT